MEQPKVEIITDRRKVDRRGNPEVEVTNAIGAILLVPGMLPVKSIDIYEQPRVSLNLYREAVVQAMQYKLFEELAAHCGTTFQMLASGRVDFRMRKDKLLTFANSGWSNRLREEVDRDIRLGHPFGKEFLSLQTGVIRRLRYLA